jgi:hypothetical protein
MSNIAETKKDQLLLFRKEKEVPVKKAGLEFIEGDMANINAMLPQLFEHQREDVFRIENRFRTGKGYLITNGTGTGKTFVGLGVIKRFWSQNKKSILVVVPTESKSKDWIAEAKILDLEINQVKDINDAGYDITITTYANFYQNEELDTRVWDLIIYDESHYLNQNMKGDETVYLNKHKNVSNVPSGARARAYSMIGGMPKRKPIEEESIDDYNDWKIRCEIWKFQIQSLKHYHVEKTKVLFLSATPFAYHKSTLYADGCLFDIQEQIEEKEATSTRYNEPSGFDSFMVQHFGYRMKYNKLTIPESGVDQNLMERNFFESHVEKGVMSTRILELDYDYSRHFIKVDSELGDFINSGMELFHKPEVREKYEWLSSIAETKYNYMYTSQLLETIKAKQVIPRIKEHLDLGRKVVVFHGFNHSVIDHPFHFDLDKLLKADTRHLYKRIEKDFIMFAEEYPEYVNLDLSDLQNTRQTLRNAFPDMVEFNGTVSPKKRKLYKEAFNDNNSDCNLILVQEKAGREGISLHDKIGDKQRVLINLSLPTAPTSAIQTEGRIYRSGLKSNAVYEYIIVGTNFEKIAFGDKIAKRARTAENLAMGNLARDLETAYKEGYLNYDNAEASLEQGTGGKEADRAIQTISDFDKSKTYYYAKQKKTSRNKAREGVDYFATPEPLGYKIAQWLDIDPNERALEPSAGHGAIARFFPGHANNTFVEPSYELFAELSINASNGRLLHETFEELSIGNKFDAIGMNPPFGVGGKLAMEHVKKAAYRHLYRFGKKPSRLIAIIPAGNSMQKRLDEFLDSEDATDIHLTGEIQLPDVVFKRAGTSVVCKIIKLEYSREDLAYCNYQDLSNCETVEEFFERIEHLDF